MKSMKKSLIFTPVVSFVLFVCPACVAQETEAVQAEAKLQQVALFKNGLGFFISQVTCPKKTDTFSFVPAAAASHGTFWVSYPQEVKLKSLIAKEVESPKSVDAITIPELLEANVGSKVRLYLSGDEVLEGLIQYCAELRKKPQADPYALGHIEQTSVDYRARDFIQGRLMILQTDEKEVGIDPQTIRMIEFLDSKARKTLATKDKSIHLDVQMTKPVAGKNLTVSYLAKGITWAPSYVVDITQHDMAMISAKALVINEACDLNDVTIQLVTGFPHLQFADIVSPVALKESLAQFLQSLTRGESERGRRDIMSNVMRQSVAYRGVGGYVDSSFMPEYGAAETGKVAEDLFLYPVQNVHLKKTEVAYLPLFSESVPYKHIYQWKIPDYVNEEDRYFYEQRRSEEREPVEEVWHCLRLQNTANVPWTTAPAEIVKEGLILGQDTLNYTPAKAESTLRITQAVSVKTEQVELEIDRDRDAAQLYGYHYDLVTVQGKLSVYNFQGKAITLEITKTLSGEIKSSQPEAKIEKLGRGLRRMNGILRLTWTIELEPSEQKKIDYTYDVYVRR